MSLWILFEEKLNAIEEKQKRIIELLSEIRTGQQIKIFDNSDLLRMFHCTQNTLAQWRTEGRINYSRIKSKFYYTEEDLKNFLENNKVKTIKTEETK